MPWDSCLVAAGDGPSFVVARRRCCAPGETEWRLRVGCSHTREEASTVPRIATQALAKVARRDLCARVVHAERCFLHEQISRSSKSQGCARRRCRTPTRRRDDGRCHPWRRGAAERSDAHWIWRRSRCSSTVRRPDARRGRSNDQSLKSLAVGARCASLPTENLPSLCARAPWRSRAALCFSIFLSASLSPVLDTAVHAPHIPQTHREHTRLAASSLHAFICAASTAHTAHPRGQTRQIRVLPHHLPKALRIPA